MLALIDGDICVYRIGFTTEEEDEKIAYWRMDELMDNILEGSKATEYHVYLTASNDKTAFRKKIYPEYKAHRTKPKPRHYEALRTYLEASYKADVVTTIEADDALGMNQDMDSVICSIDKDLLQIEGHHYNFVTDEWKTIDERTGMYNFYTQMIVGDSADNLKGVKGKGEVAACKMLADCKLEQDYFDVVRGMYGNDEEMLLNGRCFWIWRTPDDDWKHHFDRLANETNS